MRWILAAQGLFLTLVSLIVVVLGLRTLLTGERDPVVVGLFVAFFVATTVAGVQMTRRNWPKKPG